jgi:hypothetical protein
MAERVGRYRQLILVAFQSMMKPTLTLFHDQRESQMNLLQRVRPLILQFLPSKVHWSALQISLFREQMMEPTMDLSPWVAAMVAGS